MRLLPNTKLYLYLYENQAWEKAMIYFWRYNKNGNIIGVSHSSVKFWELHYFSFFKDKEFNDELNIEPNKIFLNGQGSKKLFDEIYQKSSHFTVVKALRFQYLEKFLKLRKDKKSTRKLENVLILGDINQQNSNKMINIVLDFVKLNEGEYNFYLKFHPQNRNDKYKFDLSKIKVSNQYRNII